MCCRCGHFEVGIQWLSDNHLTDIDEGRIISDMAEADRWTEQTVNAGS